MSVSLRLPLVLLLAAAACAVKSEHAGPVTADTTTSVAPPAERTRSALTTSQAGRAPRRAIAITSSSTSWAVDEAGVGPIRVGMTVAQANAAIGGGFSVPTGSGDGCAYATLTKAPKGLAVMLEKGKVVRVEVRSGDIPTANGARIGDTELKVMALYSGKVTTSPHKYLPNGHYMTVAQTTVNNRIVFETDGKKVINYRSGQQPQVEQVERCG